MARWGSAAALLVVMCLLLSNCRWPDRGPDLLWVTNKTQETLIVQPWNGHETPVTIPVGKSMTYPGQPPGCEKAPWVATTLSGDVVAEIPGACAGHEWTIYGVNNSTYR